MLRQYEPLALEFRAQESPATPAAVHLTTQFCGPDGAELALAGFWDGNDTWRVRFTPTVAGTWTWRTTAVPPLPGLDAQAGTLDVAPAAGDHLLRRHGPFLRVSADGHRLTHTDGTPFFWLGDTWWFCPSDLMPVASSNRAGIPSLFRHLVQVRAAQGYTVLHMASLGRLTTGGRDSGVTGQFGGLFEGRIDPAYWQAYDEYIRCANEAGLLPVLGFGFHQGLNEPTLEQLQALWRYVIARYGAWGVGWLVCGEYNQAGEKDAAGKSVFGERDARRVEKLLALGRFIKEQDPYRRALTVHPWWYGGEGRQAWAEPWLDFVMLQGGHGEGGPPPAFYTELYRQTPPRPFLEGECTYEGIFGFSDQVVRHNAYKALQCGSLGFTYGAHGLWYPTQDETDRRFAEWGEPLPWWRAAALPGGAQMQHLRRLYESVSWWRLEPLPAQSVVRTTGFRARTRFGVLAAAVPGEAFLLYVPAHEAPTPAAPVRLTFTGGGPGERYSIERFDPRTGAFTACGETTAAPPSPLPDLPTPDDWMIVLRRRPTAAAPTPGATAP